VKNKYDIVIIGSGLGGLVSANILCRHGYSVCVLEKNNQYGGNLQTFVRDKSLFDTGVHYIGGLDKGQNLYKYFKYLGIIQDLKLQKLDIDKFDVITFDNDNNEYYHAQGYDNFANSLIEQFPNEEIAIQSYCHKIIDVCKNFPLYNLDIRTSYDQNILSLKVSDYLDSISDNELLKSVLAGSNFLYAGELNTPFYVHALSINSFIQSAYRCVDGGGQIAKLLVERIKEFGGEVYKYHEVTSFGFKQEELKSVKTKKGNVIHADIFISNIEPKLTVKMLNGRGLYKAYVKRIEKIRSVISGFSVYLVFKPKTFKYLNYNYYHFKNTSKVWSSQNYSNSSWPDSYMISMGVTKDQSKWTESLTIMTYMKFEEVKKWETTFNTISNKSDRGEAYNKFKNEKAELLLLEVEKKFPKIRDCIQSIHTSTPLSYRDYIGSNDGAMYGYVKDAENPMKSFLSPKTRLKNLFFTGQSLNMHGILGVTISGVLTCSQIIGREKLMKTINESLKEC
jgi:phytoene dehydrogenase-like protein